MKTNGAEKGITTERKETEDNRGYIKSGNAGTLREIENDAGGTTEED